MTKTIRYLLTLPLSVKSVCAKYDREVPRDDRHIVPSAWVAYVWRRIVQHTKGRETRREGREQ